MEKSITRPVLLALAGLSAGLVNGLLGAGGGIIIVWVLAAMLSSSGGDRRDAFANSLVVMLPVSAVSAIIYGARGLADSSELGLLVIPAVVGGLCGALVLDKINIRWLKMIFASIIVYSGITMMMR